MRKALVVGFNDYPGAPLYGCVNDAVRMESVLKKNGDGSPNFHVKLLTDESGIVRKGTLKGAIEDLFSSPSDVALLYFSGHGTVDVTGGIIVTPDWEPRDEGISMDWILKVANDSKARDKIVILDCCNSGEFGNISISSSNVSLLVDGLTVLTACRNSEYAMEKRGSGVFTSLLIDGLDGGAADLRGNITPGSLYSYVDEALGAWDQRPVFKTNVSRFTVLRKITPRVPLEVIRKITDYFETPEMEYLLDPSFEFTSETADQDNVKKFKQLQELFAIGLVIPVDEQYMYFAAINSKSCRLTAMGYQYWRLVKENNL